MVSTDTRELGPCPHKGCARTDRHLHDDPYKPPPVSAEAVATAFAFAFSELSAWLMANRDRFS